MTLHIEVFSVEPFRRLGEAASFGEAKRMQQESLPADLQPLYAGIQEGMPLFYTHMITDELRAKYPALQDTETGGG